MISLHINSHNAALESVDAESERQRWPLLWAIQSSSGTLIMNKSSTIQKIYPRPSSSGVMHIGNPFAFVPRVDRIPNRRNTSEHVTRIERTIRTMMIHVRPATISVSSSLAFHHA